MTNVLARHLFCLFIVANLITSVSLFSAYGGGGGGGGGMGGGFSTSPTPSTAPLRQSNIPLNQPTTTTGQQRLSPLHGGTGAAGGTGPYRQQTQRLLPSAGPQAISVLYTVPGIATLQGGQWIGSADLYNLGSSIGIVVEIVTPNAQPLAIAEQVILNKVIPILKEGGINGHSFITGDTPLPYLHFLLMIYPIDQGFVAYVAGRLFETAKISRVFLKPWIHWQVITWEKQELLLFPSNELVPQIESVISLILKDFITQTKVKPEEEKKR